MASSSSEVTGTGGVALNVKKTLSAESPEKSSTPDPADQEVAMEKILQRAQELQLERT